MRSPPFLPPGRRAFTLIELLVSMAVLLLLTVLVVQLVNGASTAIGWSDRHLDADEEARLLFNRLSVDLSRAVNRADVDYSAFKQPAGTFDSTAGGATIPANPQPGNDQMAFYSETDGYFSGQVQPTGAQRAPASLVAWQVDNDPYTGQPGLRRLGKGLGWESDTGSWGTVVYLPMTLTQVWPQLFATGPNADPDYKTVGSQVVRFEYTYLLKPTTALAATAMQAGTPLAPLFVTPYDTKATPAAHTSIDGFQDVSAIVVAVVVVDSTSRKLITNYSRLTGNALFVDATDCTSDSTYHGDPAAAWNAQVYAPAFASAAGLSSRAAAGVRVYERYFYLNRPN